MNSLLSAKRVHVIGIGGIGLSALAQYFAHHGARVIGSDSSESPVAAHLRTQGITVFIGHRKEQLSPDTELVLYSVAIAKDNPELVAAKTLGINILSYPQGLAELTRTHDTIAVAGTHGKTTTTAMIGDVLFAASLDPTVIVGSLMSRTGSNLLVGDGKHFVLEADEYRRAFLNYTPKIILLTNIDVDHLDYYKDLADIQSAFRTFAEKLSAEGVLITDLSSPTILPILSGLSCRVVDWRSFLPQAHTFTLHVPGEHNIWNAACALAVAEELHISPSTAEGALAAFRGTWRRIEEKGTTTNGVTVYDDYGHNPTEIRATLKALHQKYPSRQLTVLFQPHLYSRTKLLLADFATCFADADRVLVTDIYAAREAPDPSISGEILASEIAKHHPDVTYIGSLEAVMPKLTQLIPPRSLFLTQGAGDGYKVGEAFLRSASAV